MVQLEKVLATQAQQAEFNPQNHIKVEGKDGVLWHPQMHGAPPQAH